MDLDKVKTAWSKQNENNTNELILKLFKESRMDKVESKMRKTKYSSILMVLLNIIVNIYAWMKLAENIDNISIIAVSSLLLILSFISMYMNIFQLNRLLKLDESMSVIKYQKAIEKIKIDRINHNRFIFIFSHLYTIIFIVLIFNIDLSTLLPHMWENAKIWLLIQASILVLYFPFTLWILSKYDNLETASKFWKLLEKDSFLTDSSVNSSLNNAIKHLEEIRDYEKE